MTTPLTSLQAADRLGVSRSLILLLIKTGQLRAEKVGMQYLIRPGDLAKIPKRRRPGRPRKQTGRDVGGTK